MRRGRAFTFSTVCGDWGREYSSSLASDMITRMLVLVSRRNVPQAQKLMSETRRILHTVLQNVTATLPPPTREGGPVTRNRKELLTMSAVRAIQSIMQDMQILSEALDEQADTFALDQRNFGAQQVSRSLCLSTGGNADRFVCVGQGAPRPEKLERSERDRASVLDDRQLHRAGVSKYRLGCARVIALVLCCCFYMYLSNA